MPRTSNVDTSPHRKEIADLLAAGWSAARVHAYLVAQRGDGPHIPSVHSIERYRTHIPPAAVLPSSLIKQALKGLRHRVDTLKILNDMIFIQEDRILHMWQRENDTGVRERDLTPAMRTLRDYLRDRQRIVVELRERRPSASKRPPEEPQTRLLDIPAEGLRELTDLLRWRRQQGTNENHITPEDLTSGPTRTSTLTEPSVIPNEGPVILSEAEGSLTVPPSHQIPSPGGEG